MDRERGRQAGRAGLTSRPPGRGDLVSSARRIALAGETVDYRLIRARRRTIGMAVAFAIPPIAAHPPMMHHRDSLS